MLNYKSSQAKLVIGFEQEASELTTVQMAAIFVYLGDRIKINRYRRYMKLTLHLYIKSPFPFTNCQFRYLFRFFISLSFASGEKFSGKPRTLTTAADCFPVLLPVGETCAVANRLSRCH